MRPSQKQNIKTFLKRKARRIVRPPAGVGRDDSAEDSTELARASACRKTEVIFWPELLFSGFEVIARSPTSRQPCRFHRKRPTKLSITHKTGPQKKTIPTVGKSGHAAPHYDISWRRMILGSSEIPAQSGDFRIFVRQAESVGFCRGLPGFSLNTRSRASQPRSVLHFLFTVTFSRRQEGADTELQMRDPGSPSR
jgi:hypothetical protein